MLLLKQDIIKKKWVNNYKLVQKPEFQVRKDKKYKVEAIWDSAVYINAY